MRAQIEKELEGKDLRRVEPQLRRQARLQRDRTIAQVLTSCACLVALAYHLYSGWMSAALVFTAIFMLVLGVLGSVADFRSHKYKKHKLAVIAELLRGA